jgi:spermidine/putrescine transport system ATP-binding protein
MPTPSWSWTGAVSSRSHADDIYNDPKNAFVADFIGESNIFTHHARRLSGEILAEVQCHDTGFLKTNRGRGHTPRDVDIVPSDAGHLCAQSPPTPSRRHYDVIVDFKGFKWLIQPRTTTVGTKSEYSSSGRHPRHEKERILRMFGTTAPFREYDEINDPRGHREENLSSGRGAR